LLAKIEAHQKCLVDAQLNRLGEVA
jgi:hypothetical protein